MNRSRRAVGGLAVAAASGAGLVPGVALGGYAGPVVSPPTLNFGEVASGSTSPVQTLTLDPATITSAKGGMNIDIVSITFPPGYARSGGTCPASGVANNGCTVGVVFQPTGLGVAGGNIDISALSFGVGPGTTSVAVSGTGVPPASGVPAMGVMGTLILIVGVAAVAATRLLSR